MNIERIEKWMDRMTSRIKMGFVWGLVLFGLLCAVRFTVESYGLCAVVFWVGATATGFAAKWHFHNAIQDGKDTFKCK